MRARRRSRSAPATAGLAAIALTDHDTTAGVAEPRRARRATSGVRVVAAASSACARPGGSCTCSRYFLRSGRRGAPGVPRDTRAARRRRGEQMVEKLQGLGVEIDLEDVGRAGGRRRRGPAARRARAGRARRRRRHQRGVRPLPRPRPRRVTSRSRCRRCAASPTSCTRSAASRSPRIWAITVTEAQIAQFQEQGLDGVEVRHPSHSPAVEARLTSIAERLGLAISGGSDWHGESEFGGSHAPLGGHEVPAGVAGRPRTGTAKRGSRGREPRMSDLLQVGSKAPAFTAAGVRRQDLPPGRAAQERATSRWSSIPETTPLGETANSPPCAMR